jgi:uncharacterized membrane protein YjfL (UPF0719 family)
MIALIVFLLAFGIGFSSTVWAVNSEIYPIHLTGTAMSLATATNFFGNFIVVALFLSLIESDEGKVYTWGIFAGFTLLAFLFVYFLLPETKGKKIEDNV